MAAVRAFPIPTLTLATCAESIRVSWMMFPASSTTTMTTPRFRAFASASADAMTFLAAASDNTSFSIVSGSSARTGAPAATARTAATAMYVTFVMNPSAASMSETGSRFQRRKEVSNVIEILARVIEVAGVGIIGIGSATATIEFFRLLVRKAFADAYEVYRRRLGQAILLGLEFLVAADIIQTVTVSPTLESVGILASIVAIRTFLSTTLAVEIEGQWPWRRSQRRGVPE